MALPTHSIVISTVYPKKYAHGFCFAVPCCGYTLTDFPISIRLTSLALWQSNDCPSASKATVMNMDKLFMWIHYERLHNHNKAIHNKTVCIFLGIYCIQLQWRKQWEHIWIYMSNILCIDVMLKIYFIGFQILYTTPGHNYSITTTIHLVQNLLCYFAINYVRNIGFIIIHGLKGHIAPYTNIQNRKNSKHIS